MKNGEKRIDLKIVTNQISSGLLDSCWVTWIKFCVGSGGDEEWSYKGGNKKDEKKTYLKKSKWI